MIFLVDSERFAIVVTRIEIIRWRGAVEIEWKFNSRLCGVSKAEFHDDIAYKCLASRLFPWCHTFVQS